MRANRPARWPALDGLRAVAVAIVSLFHLFVVYVPSWNPLRPAGGYLGVDMFFVLSGFLITSILLAEFNEGGTISIRASYWRRALRLSPPWRSPSWSPASASARPSSRDKPGVAPPLLTLPWVVFYAGNWNAALYGGRIPLGALGHTWSLAVEEQF